MIKWQCPACGAIRVCNAKLDLVLCTANSTCPRAWKQMRRVGSAKKAHPVPMTQSELFREPSQAENDPEEDNPY